MRTFFTIQWHPLGWVLLLCLYLSGPPSQAQTYTIGTASISSCAGTIYDSGGAGGNYGNNQTLTSTLTPATAGTMARLVFSTFNTENTADFLNIYDGANSSAPLIGAFTGTGSVGTVPTTITATNATGKLTLVFTSNNTTTRAGFAAAISCVSVPSITSFTPTSGLPGASVVITGTNFTGATAVAFNGTAATTYTVNSATQITATVPVFANTGPISVTNAGVTATSATNFTVPPPTIASFTPTSGLAGTSVVITGTNLTQALVVTFNSAAATFVVNSNTQITATVPIGVSTGPVGIISAAGTATSTTNFTIPPPTITSFTPTSGAAGTSVVITGTNFTGTTDVAFNTVAATFVVNSNTQITATVPADASTGPVRVNNSGVTVASTGIFNTGLYTMDNQAVSTCTGTFTDSGGPNNNYQDNEAFTKTFTPGTAGSKVRLTFSAFSTDDGYDFLTFYDGPDTSAPLIGSFTGTNSPGTITATNAAGQLTCVFTSDGSFTDTGFDATVSCLANAPTITSFTPTIGSAGTSVVITGTHFTGATAVGFNGTAAPGFVVNSATQVTASVPSGASTGRITVTTAVGTGSSATNFTVDHINIGANLTACSGMIYDSGGPTGTYQDNEDLTSTLTPGTPGSLVRLVFSAFDTEGCCDNLKIYDGPDASAPLLGTFAGNTLPGTITATNATGQLTLVFTSDGGVFKAGFAAAVSCFNPALPSATITSFTPTSGPVGTSVVITGTNFTGATVVTFNGTAATYTVVSPTQITTSVPVGASSGPISITGSNGATVISAVSFDTGTLIIGANLTTCAAMLYDSGGATANYQDDEDRTSTLTPGTAGSKVQLVFSAFSTEGCCDNLKIYDGPNASAPLLGTFAGNTLPGTITATNATGQLTCVFHSDSGINLPGFAAAISCVTVPTVTSFTPTSGLPGTSVVITGTGFTGATAVRFNGTAATTYTVNSATQITATVPGAAATGTVSVTSGAPGTSASAFTVLTVYNALLNQCLTSTSISSTGTGQWQYLMAANGQVVAAINDQGHALGTVSAEYTLAALPAVRADSRGIEYLDRNWHLVAQNAFTGQSVSVRFYGLNSEFSRYVTANDGDANDVTSLGQLRLTQYAGPNEDCSLTNNVGGVGSQTRLLTPTAASAMPGASWFVVESNVADHFSEFYLSGGSTPLPVELVAFSAQRQPNGRVAAAWRTASEKNSSGFELERSANGQDFKVVSPVIAGAGTSATAHAYAWTDETAPTGRLYYRLRQTDAGGAVQFSPVVPVSDLSAANTWQVYPNPAQDYIHASGLPANQRVELLDAIGRVVVSQLIPASGGEITMPLSGLPAGMYLLRVGSQSRQVLIDK